MRRVLVTLTACAACAVGGSLSACGGSDGGVASPGPGVDGGGGGQEEGGGGGGDASQGHPGPDSSAPGADGAGSSETGGGGDGGVVTPPTDGSISSDLPARYPGDAVHSPITASVVKSINAIIASHHRDPKLFMRFGDANCGTETQVFEQPNSNNLALVGLPNAASFQTTRDWFEGTKVAGADPNSSCAANGCSSWSWIGVFCNDNTLAATSAVGSSGSQTAFSKQLSLNGGAFAMVQFGGAEQDDLAPKTGPGSENVDINGFGDMGYAQAIWELTDELIAQGVVPLLRGFPMRWFPTNDAMCSSTPAGGYPMATVPFSPTGTGLLMDTIKRGIAEARQIPFASFNVRATQLATTPPFTVDPCGIHMVQPSDGPGDFSNLKLGYPIDNLNIIEQIDRVRQVAQGNWTPENNPGPARAGTGTSTDPFVIDGLPFADLRDLSAAAASPITNYSSCAPTGHTGPTVSGPAYFYRVDVTGSGVAVRVSATGRFKSAVDQKVVLRHFMNGTVIGDCTPSADEQGNTLNNYYRMHLAAGTHYFTVAATDNLTAGATTPPEMLLAIQPCEADDPYCK
jgi:hypothetical protein